MEENYSLTLRCYQLTSELNPRVIIMKKKRIDQRGGRGMVDKASGYTTNVNPGPKKEP